MELILSRFSSETQLYPPKIFLQKGQLRVTWLLNNLWVHFLNETSENLDVCSLKEGSTANEFIYILNRYRRNRREAKLSSLPWPLSSSGFASWSWHATWWCPLSVTFYLQGNLWVWPDRPKFERLHKSCTPW